MAATITSLPSEILTLIMQLSTLPSSWATFSARSSHLRNVALACRAMRGPAQEELFRHPVLSTTTSSRLFVAVIKPSAGSRFASAVRSLRVGSAATKREFDEPIPGRLESQEKFAIRFILGRCLMLADLWCARIEFDSLSAIVQNQGERRLLAPMLRIGAECGSLQA